MAKEGTTAAGTQVTLTGCACSACRSTASTSSTAPGSTAGNRLTCTASVVDDPPRSAAALRRAVGRALDAGQRGTLADEYGGSPLSGILRGKTGSLDGVTGFVALVDPARDLRFVYLANGEFSETGGVALRNRIAETVSGFPDAPPADALVPGPVTTPAPPAPGG